MIHYHQRERRRARLVVAAAALVTVPLGWIAHGLPSSSPLHPLVVLGCLAVMLRGSLRASSLRGRPAAFTGSATGAFVVQPHHRSSAPGTAALLVLVGFGVARTAPVANASRGLAPLVWVVSGLAATLAMAFVLTFLADVPRVELTASGLVVHGFLHRYEAPWAALDAARLPPAAYTSVLRLPVARRDLVRGVGLVRRRPRAILVLVQPLAVHPWFLADAIRYYVDHPERRAAIGAQAEHGRLRAAVMAPGGR